nr:flagellar hook capping FlgD N-terminal domain-containing protein [Escherichia coli]
MSIAVTTTDPTNTGVSTTSSSSLTGSNAADLQSSFLTLLVAQLKNQDPTNPSNGKQRADVAIGTNQHGQRD